MTKKKNTLHNKVKEDIYFIWIMRKLLKAFDNFIFSDSNWYWWSKWFWIFILKNEEVSLFNESKLSNIFFNYYKNNKWEKTWIKFEYKLNDEYILFVYCLWINKNEIQEIMKSNILTLQSIFRDDNLKVFQPKLLDIFWLYWSFTTILILFHYLNRSVFWFYDVFWSWSVKKNLWEYWKWDVTIDISILERIIKEWKEKFKEKLDLLYLLFSNINKKIIQHYYFRLFFDLPKEWIENFKINEEDIKKQDSNCEFKTYHMKINYLCSYLFKEFFNDSVYWWSKKLISFYNREDSPNGVYDWKDYVEKYKNFNLEYLKKVELLIDKQLYKKF